MIAIDVIISQFSTEEQQEFVKYLLYKNKRHDTKNVQLFQLLLANYPAKEIPKKLYGKDNKTAYHGLRKRLWSSLVDFMATQSLTHEVSDELAITKRILVARNLLLQKQFKTAFKILNKVEKKAREILHFSLLNEVYHTQIQYAHKTDFAPSLEVLIEKCTANQQDFLQEEKLNMAYAVIQEQLQKVVFKGEIISFQSLIQETYERFGVSKEIGLSYKSLYQLAQIINSVADVNKAYFAIEPFILENYKYISNRLKQTDKHLFYHIKVLYLISNIFFRKKEFAQSLNYLARMKTAMEQQKQRYYKSSLVSYQCLLALNYNYAGNSEKAIILLEEVIHLKKYDLEIMLDVHLSLIVFYFQQGEFKKAQKIGSKFYHTDKWYEEKAGVEWVIKKNLIELLLHIELGNISYVDSRFVSFQRKYYPFLKKSGQSRVITFLKFVKEYYNAPETVTSEVFRMAVKDSFEWKVRVEEDIFVMSFYAWLKAKMNKTNLYKTTLELMELD
ncbi:MAG: tetratricopeptide repeat protein [Kordia sp.]|uniref:tetratricopeptide repeat protein n=1 Tax=Kordia sp. TaxID=1965332 RepID=UPI0038596000